MGYNSLERLESRFVIEIYKLFLFIYIFVHQKGDIVKGPMRLLLPEPDAE